MLNGAFGKPKSASLMGEYSTLLGDAVLRNRTRAAEHAARIEAELANRVKSEFIANMSHELRTPLNTVIGFSKILTEHDRRRIPDKEIVEYAQLILDGAGHLLSVINDILDISKMQSGRYTLDAREINIGDVLKSAILSLKDQSDEAGLEIEVRIAPGLPAVRGDAGKLRQVFANILSNAVKFTTKGGSVAVEALRLAEGGVVILVRDTGIGMTLEELQVALSPFGQVDGGHSRWREGTGLGLPIAMALVELHGGELKVRSVKGQGTEVAILFPPKDQISISEARDAVIGSRRQGL
jgi:two-component system, cell cycle sensor histidine kinase PleC